MIQITHSYLEGENWSTKASLAIMEFSFGYKANVIGWIKKCQEMPSEKEFGATFHTFNSRK